MGAQRRSEIARLAVEARWSKQGKQPLPRASHAGPLHINEIEFDCAVLEDGTRVISEQKFMAAMGMYRSGALSVRRKNDDGELHAPLFLAYKNLQPFVEQHLGATSFRPLRYVTLEGNVAHGISAELIPKICEIWIDADRAGELGVRQKTIAKKADILLRGLAHVGIVALVDEATGYQDVRAKDALAKILEAYVAKELRKWVSTFPIEYYRQIYRLRGWPFPSEPEKQTQRPIMIGKLTNDVVYERLAPGVKHELQRLTPRDSKGRLKKKLFQRLTEEVGHPKLLEHLASVIAIMKLADDGDWDRFMQMLDRALPRYGDTIPLPLSMTR